MLGFAELVLDADRIDMEPFLRTDLPKTEQVLLAPITARFSSLSAPLSADIASFLHDYFE